MFLKDINVKNKTALISKSNDQATFLKNLMSLINSKEKREKFSKLAVEKSKEFDYSYLINNIKNLYDD